jgi:hypothetical protein
MTTALNKLDLNAAYKHAMETLGGDGVPHRNARVEALNVVAIIEALRTDGLAPPKNLEIVALEDIPLHGFKMIGPELAERIVKYLHERGYKIVKEKT